MTKEESIDIMKAIIYMLEPMYDTDRVEDAVSMAIKALEQESPLDKIIAEIKMYEADCRLQGGKDECEKCNSNVFGSVYRIIDKHKAEEELRMEKHTDRQIYDGCIHLMQKMVDYFQEYLEYLGYDLDKLDKDERFEVGMSNMEIVRWLFLFHTRNSGGCSTRDFCEKLGVDPYKSVKFEFEESEEI